MLQPEIIEAYRSRVELGAKVMDKLYPCWREDIDVSTLDIASPRNCIGGQASHDAWDDLCEQVNEEGYAITDIGLDWDGDILYNDSLHNEFRKKGSIKPLIDDHREALEYLWKEHLYASDFEVEDRELTLA